jgi:hypothetical protein
VTNKKNFFFFGQTLLNSNLIKIELVNSNILPINTLGGNYSSSKKDFYLLYSLKKTDGVLASSN